MNREIEGSFLTRRGLRLIDKLLASKASLRLTRACAGDGVLGEDQNPKLFDQLLHQTADLSIAGIYNAEGGEAVMHLQATSLGVQQGYFIREAGVYAQDPDEGEVLYAYAVLEEPLWIRPEKHTVSNIADLLLTVIVSEVQEVTVDISTGALVTVPMFEERMRPLEPAHSWIELEHNLGGYPLVQICSLKYGAGLGLSGEPPAGGTELWMHPAQPVYHDPYSMTIRTVRPVLELGTPVVERIDSHRYLVTFEGNDADSVYIELWTGQQATPLPPQTGTGIVFTNLRIGDTPPDDLSDVWGVLKS